MTALRSTLVPLEQRDRDALARVYRHMLVRRWLAARKRTDADGRREASRLSRQIAEHDGVDITERRRMARRWLRDECAANQDAHRFGG